MEHELSNEGKIIALIHDYDLPPSTVARIAEYFLKGQYKIEPIVPEYHLTNNNRMEIFYLVSKGQKIAAIKRFREYTGKDLTESKNIVEEMISLYRQTENNNQHILSRSL